MPQIKFHAVGAHEGKTITLGRFDFVDGVHAFSGSPQDVEIITKTMREQYSAVPEDEFEAAKKAFDEAQAESALAEPETTPASTEMTIKQRILARRFIDEKLDPSQVYGPGPAADAIKAHMSALKSEDEDGDDVLNASELAERQAAIEEAERVKRETEEKAEKERLEKEAADKAEKERLDKEAADKAAAEAAEKEKADAQAKEKADKEAADKAEADRIAAEEAAKQGQQSQDDGSGGQQSQDNGGGQQQPEGAKIETVADALQALDAANDEHWTARGVPSIEAMTKLLGRSVTRAEIEEVAPDYTRSVAKAAKAAS